jgi:hypothetical protein
MSSVRSFYVRLLFAALAATPALAACGGGAKQVTPSGLVNDASTYDGQTVTVSGTAKNPETRKTRRGTAVMYQLCDTNCIHVFQFGSTTPVTDGATVSVTGMFRASFGRMQQINNVVIVGGRGGRWNGNRGGGSPQASPGSQ